MVVSFALFFMNVCDEFYKTRLLAHIILLYNMILLMSHFFKHFMYFELNTYSLFYFYVLDFYGD